MAKGWPRVGGGERNRTVDLLLAKQALSRLSYTPEPEITYLIMVGLGRIELPTSRLSGVRSNRTELQARTRDQASGIGNQENLPLMPAIPYPNHLRPKRKRCEGGGTSRFPKAGIRVQNEN